MGYSDTTQYRRFIATSKKAFAPHILELINEVNQKALSAGYDLEDKDARWVIVKSDDSDQWTVVLHLDEESFVASVSRD